MTIRRAIKEFIRYCQTTKNYAPNTIRNYKYYLRTFEQWAEANRVEEIEQLTTEDVEEYTLYLKKREQPLSSSTTNYYLIALRAMLRYLVNRDIQVAPPDKVILGKIPGRQVEFLEPEETTKLLEVINGSDLAARRDRAIVSLLFSTGLRISELIALTRNKVGKNTIEFSVMGKGGKVRPVFLTEIAQEMVSQYLTARQDTNPYLFIRHFQNPVHDSNKKPLTARSIQRLLTDYAKIAGIEKAVTPHKLRHSFATDLLRNGADLRSVQALLGHSSITTTQVYTHITDKTLRDIHEKFHSQNVPVTKFEEEK